MKKHFNDMSQGWHVAKGVEWLNWQYQSLTASYGSYNGFLNTADFRGF